MLSVYPIQVNCNENCHSFRHWHCLPATGHTGIVIQMPATPIRFVLINFNTVTSIIELFFEIIAEINPFPSAVKYPERNTFRPINTKTVLNSFNPSQVSENTFPSPTNK